MFLFTKIKKLRKRKEFQLFELEKDLFYITSFKDQALLYDEKAGRKELANLNLKKKGAGITEAEQKRIEELTDKITESASVKNEVEKTMELISEMKNYLSIL